MMASFAFRGITDGGTVSGRVEAPNLDAAQSAHLKSNYPT